MPRDVLSLDIPSVFNIPNDNFNQIAKNMFPREYRYVNADTNSLTSAAPIEFDLGNTRELLSLNEMTIGMKVTISSTASTTTYDMSRLITAISIEHDSKNLITLSNTWVVPVLDSLAEGTQSRDIIDASYTTVPMGTARNYHVPVTGAEAIQSYMVYIPLATYTTIFDNAYFPKNRSLKFKITFDDFSKLDAVSVITSLSNFRLYYVNNRATPDLLDMYYKSINTRRLYEKQFFYRVNYSKALDSGKASTTMSHSTRSLEQIAFFAHNNTYNSNYDITAISYGNITVNNQPLTNGSITDTAYLNWISMEAVNSLTDKFIGMKPSWYTAQKQTDGIPHCPAGMLSVGVEDIGGNTATGIDTYTGEGVKFDLDITTSGTSMMYSLLCRGKLVFDGEELYTVM